MRHVTHGEEGAGSGQATVRAGATRSAIMEQAAILFAVKGFDGTTFADIAAATGVTRPAVYHYFRSKEDLLSDLIAETSVNAAARLEEIRDSDMASTQKLRQMAEEVIRERLQFPERFLMVERSEASLPEPVASSHRAARIGALSAVSAVIEEGVLAGEFRACDDRLGALSVLGVCNWVAWWYRPGGRISAEKVVGTLADNVIAMFAPQEGRTLREPGAGGVLAMIRQDVDLLERLIVSDDPAEG